MTQLYEEALRPSGLRVTQFSILAVVDAAGGLAPARLGRVLGIDVTTLTRTVALLRRRGWLRARPGEDLRERRLEVTREGKARLRRARPPWERAQKRLRAKLGGGAWDRMNGMLLRAGAAARDLLEGRKEDA